ncbi:unnamed protein product, partial [Amoebophrya sp. A25]
EHAELGERAADEEQNSADEGKSAAADDAGEDSTADVGEKQNDACRNARIGDADSCQRSSEEDCAEENSGSSENATASGLGEAHDEDSQSQQLDEHRSSRNCSEASDIEEIVDDENKAAENEEDSVVDHDESGDQAHTNSETNLPAEEEESEVPTQDEEDHLPAEEDLTCSSPELAGETEEAASPLSPAPAPPPATTTQRTTYIKGASKGSRCNTASSSTSVKHPCVASSFTDSATTVVDKAEENCVRPGTGEHLLLEEEVSAENGGHLLGEEVSARTDEHLVLEEDQGTCTSCTPVPTLKQAHTAFMLLFDKLTTDFGGDVEALPTEEERGVVTDVLERVNEWKKSQKRVTVDAEWLQALIDAAPENENAREHQEEKAQPEHDNSCRSGNIVLEHKQEHVVEKEDLSCQSSVSTISRKDWGLDQSSPSLQTPLPFLDDAPTQGEFRLRTYNEQHETQKHFSLQSVAATCNEVVGCPWCRRPLLIIPEQQAAAEKMATRESALVQNQIRPCLPVSMNETPELWNTRTWTGRGWIDIAKHSAATTTELLNLNFEKPIPMGLTRQHQQLDIEYIILSRCQEYNPAVDRQGTSVMKLPEPPGAGDKRSVPRSRFAHVGLTKSSNLVGAKFEYVLGAMVLGESLRESKHDVVLLHSACVPMESREVLRGFYDYLIEVPLLDINTNVASTLFRNPDRTRFKGVFTKLQVLALECYEKVLFFDLDTVVKNVSNVDFLLERGHAPAALQRGEPRRYKRYLREMKARKQATRSSSSIRTSGVGEASKNVMEQVPYRAFWSDYDRKVWPPNKNKWGQPVGQSYRERLWAHQQASGINAGVMLLKPSRKVLEFIEWECWDSMHPEHYATHMPEQEYLGRLFAVLDLEYSCSHMNPPCTAAATGEQHQQAVFEQNRISPYRLTLGHRRSTISGMERTKPPPRVSNPAKLQAFSPSRAAAAKDLELVPRLSFVGGRGDTDTTISRSSLNCVEQAQVGATTSSSTSSASFEGWYRLPPTFNYEVDKAYRIPF